ncbi:MAG: spore protease [Clostridia bacterium]|nr:spore protease [Clostridia bacterium]
MKNIRTDLAIEARELYGKGEKRDIPGVVVDVQKEQDITITRVKVEEDVGARIIGKAKGNYITLEVPRLRENDKDLQEDVTRALAKEMGALIKINNQSVILVVGLGNWNITPDALGPKVVDHLLVTRHVKEYLPDQIDESVRSVCAVAPGVLGITGIETSEIIRGIVDRIRPDVVIVIDALASRKLERVSTTIQIADTGINPGSGVGNNRKQLSKETLGIPVVAIGVPTVVDAATMTNDTIDMVLDSMIESSEKDSEFYKMLKNMNRDDKYKLIQEVLYPFFGHLMVTPKEIDRLIEDISIIIADGLNVAIHPGVDTKDLGRYIN